MSKVFSPFEGIRQQLKRLRKMPSKVYPRILPDDVFLVTYPRSGSTWMRYLLANLMESKVDWHISNISRIVPDIHEGIPPHMIATKPRIIKSHEPYCNKYPRVIYLYRDGRDVSLSFYDYYRKLRCYDKDFRTFLREMLQGRLAYGTWQDHVSSWLFNETQTPILSICYEELYKDTTERMKSIGSFLGLRWNKNEIMSAMAKSTLEKQRQDFYLYKRETHWNRGFQGGIQGSPGKWREVFDEHLHELFWEYAGEVAKRLGYSKR